MTAFKPSPLNYILGLNIGITSVGWAMVGIDDKENLVRLIDLGACVLERMEMPKTEDSLTVARHLMHSIHRLARRRTHRLLRMHCLLKHGGILKPEDFDEDGLARPLPYVPKQSRNAPW